MVQIQKTCRKQTTSVEKKTYLKFAMLSWDMRMDRDVEYHQRNRCISVRNSSDQAQPRGRQLYLLYTHEHGWFPSLGQTDISLNCWNCHQKTYVGVTGSFNKQICLSLYIYEIWKEKKYKNVVFSQVHSYIM